MSYQIDIPDRERAYLEGLPLSPDANERLDRFIEQFIAEVSDEFRLDTDNRPSPTAPYFLVRHIILDHAGDRRMHTIDFHIRDDKAKFGALLIVFVDHH